MENTIDDLQWWPEPPGWLDGDDDPSGGADDELTEEELSAMYDGSRDGPDPQLHPEAYPELAHDGDLRAAMAASVLDAAGPADGVDEPGPVRGLSDAELVESLGQWRAVASRAAARELRATAELLRRRPARQWDHRGDDRDAAPVRVSRAAVQEIALGLTLTGYGAQTQADLADALQWRLPRTFKAMETGAIDRAKAGIIAEATSLLDDEAARQADAVIAEQAAAMTTGELRTKLPALVIKIDPKAAEERRRRAERKARVRLYANPDHTATLAAENLPAAPAVAAFARVAAVAAAMKSAGMKGGIELLRSRALIGLLLGNLPVIPSADQQGTPGTDEPEGPPDGPECPQDGPGGPPEPPEPPGPPDEPADPAEPDEPPAAARPAGQPAQPAGCDELYGWDQDPDDPEADD